MEHKSNKASANGASHGRPNRSRRRRRSTPAISLRLLDSAPESRAELVARAGRLVRDPGYPSDDMLWMIAQLLATRIEKDPVSY